MGTHGWSAVRYKNKYYRRRVAHDGYPEGLGRDVASQIPRNAARREAWIEQIKADQIKHHEELADRPEDDGDFCSPDVVDDTVWITGEECVRWTYVIDLDYRAFSVNGEVHFKLDNMPRNPTFDQYFEINNADGEIVCLPVPEEYLTTVSYWPDPTFNVEEVSKNYDQLESLTVGLEGWGAPSWDSLAVCQHLSVELIKTIIADHKKTLVKPDLASESGKVLLIGWQVASAAAPSHVLCPAEATPLSVEARHAIVANARRRTRPRIIPYQISVDVYRFLRPYCWFRGCLLKFCLRLDEDAWFKLEVIQMVKQLRKNGQVNGVGILVSSYQLAAVTVDGSEVRHSPVMEFHNTKGDVRDGLLLLVHLLAPAATIRKIPWRSAPSTVQSNPSPTLPEEVIQNVLRFTDDDTYHFVLPLVSRLVRAMCLARPRIGNFVLTRANSDGTYQVLSTQGLGTEIRARLARKDNKVDPGFLHVFQHHQVGVGGQSETFDKRMEARRKREPYELTGMSWDSLMKGKDIPTMRVQVVNGTWGMVGVGEEVTGGA